MTETVLFLDVDGVLNHRAIFLPSRNGSPLCPMAVQRLQQLVAAVGYSVVLSSTWRMLDRHVDLLRSCGGFPSPHADWRTVEMPGRNVNGIIHPDRRGDEIAEWLSRHPEVIRFAIVDDDDDMLDWQHPFFVRTRFDTGLTDAHTAALAAILTRPL